MCIDASPALFHQTFLAVKQGFAKEYRVNPPCTSDRIERLFGLLSANILHEIIQIQRTGWDHVHSLKT